MSKGAFEMVNKEQLNYNDPITYMSWYSRKRGLKILLLTFRTNF